MLIKNKHHSTEEIILILRQGDGGQTVKSVCREHNISEASFYRWRKKSGDMDLTGAKRLKELAKENAELKKTGRVHVRKPRALRGQFRNVVRPTQKRQAVKHVVRLHLCYERRACRYLGLHHSKFGYQAKQPTPRQQQLHQWITDLSWSYPR